MHSHRDSNTDRQTSGDDHTVVRTRLKKVKPAQQQAAVQQATMKIHSAVDKLVKRIAELEVKLQDKNKENKKLIDWLSL